MGKHKSKRVHCPGSLMDSRPISPEQVARFERRIWELCPEQYARMVWAQISRMVEG